MSSVLSSRRLGVDGPENRERNCGTNLGVEPQHRPLQVLGVPWRSASTTRGRPISLLKDGNQKKKKKKKR